MEGRQIELPTRLVRAFGPQSEFRRQPWQLSLSGPVIRPSLLVFSFDHHPHLYQLCCLAHQPRCAHGNHYTPSNVTSARPGSGTAHIPPPPPPPGPPLPPLAQSADQLLFSAQGPPNRLLGNLILLSTFALFGSYTVWSLILVSLPFSCLL